MGTGTVIWEPSLFSYYACSYALFRVYHYVQLLHQQVYVAIILFVSHRFGAYDDVNITAIQRAREEGLGGVVEYETMEMVSHDYEALDNYNKEYETIDTPGTRRQLAGAYNVTTCEAYGTKTSISTQPDGYEVTQCPAYVTTTLSEQRGASPQARDASAEDDSLKEREQGQGVV